MSLRTSHKLSDLGIQKMQAGCLRSWPHFFLTKQHSRLWDAMQNKKNSHGKNSRILSNASIRPTLLTVFRSTLANENMFAYILMSLFYIVPWTSWKKIHPQPGPLDHRFGDKLDATPERKKNLLPTSVYFTNRVDFSPFRCHQRHRWKW